MERRRKKAGKATAESYSELVHDVGRLIIETQELARQHGLFPNNREFLECRKCGLLEGVTMVSKLFERLHRLKRFERCYGSRFERLHRLKQFERFKWMQRRGSD